MFGEPSGANGVFYLLFRLISFVRVFHACFFHFVQQYVHNVCVHDRQNAGHLPFISSNLATLNFDAHTPGKKGAQNLNGIIYIYTDGQIMWKKFENQIHRERT